MLYETTASPSIWLWQEGPFNGLGSIQAEFWALAGLAVIADLRPFPAGNSLRLSRVFVSLAFTFAIVLVWGVLPAVAVQVLAIFAGAIRLRWGVKYTIGLVARFTLAFAAAGAILSLPGAPQLQLGFHITGTDAAFGRALRLGIVAEGVEDETTAAQLDAAGCEAAQGWFYARAMDPNAFEAWLNEAPGRAAAVTSAKMAHSQPALRSR